MTADLETRAHFVSRWTQGTMIGSILAYATAFVGTLIYEAISDVAYTQFGHTTWYENFRFDLVWWGIILFVLLLMGGVIGLAQWQFALKSRIPKWHWITASACIAITLGITLWLISGSLPYPIVSIVSTDPSSEYDLGRLVLETTWLIPSLIIGTSVGLGIGLPTWIVLRGHIARANWWLVANIVSGLVSMACFIAYAVILRIAWCASCECLCITPLVFGLITGHALHRLLRHPKVSQSTGATESQPS